MQTISPIAVQAFQDQTINLIGQLEDVEYHADRDRLTEQEIPLLREAVRELSLVIRGLLVAHKSAGTGRCGLCGIPWPCSVTESVYRLAKDPETAFHEIVKQVRS
jgi:hypothetical protein